MRPAWLKEFQAFALKGNVVDMAVGVIVGGAFGKIVTSLVGDIIMPAFALLTGSTQGVANLAFRLSDAEDAPVIKYGAFCQTIIDFLIISLSIFFAIRLLCKLKAKKQAEAPAAPEPPPTPEEILLLREIRDSLRK